MRCAPSKTGAAQNFSVELRATPIDPGSRCVTSAEGIKGGKRCLKYIGQRMLEGRMHSSLAKPARPRGSVSAPGPTASCQPATSQPSPHASAQPSRQPQDLSTEASLLR